MNSELKNAFGYSLKELRERENKNPEDIYGSMYSQIEFVYDCMENGKNVESELQGRSLNFHLLAGRNLAGPDDKKLADSISTITSFLMKY